MHQHRFLAVRAREFPERHRLDLAVDANHASQKPFSHELEKLADRLRLELQNLLPLLRRFTQLVRVLTLNIDHNLRHRLRRHLFISELVIFHKLVKMILLCMQLAPRQIHQILLEVDVVVIIPVVLDEQRPLLGKTFRKQRYQRFRHQAQLQFLSVPRENLLRRKERFPQL